MSEKIITNAGLSKDQVKIYLFLLENGLSPAKIISSKTSIGRSLTYKILGQMTELGLVEKRDGMGKVLLFFPAHPKRLKELLIVKKDRAVEEFQSLESEYGRFASLFNLLSGKPNVQFFEGVEGLKSVHEDILEIGQDIYIISSPITKGRTEVLNLIREQIKKQVARNIRTKAITPHAKNQVETTTPMIDDGKNLITRKVLPAEKLNIPAQIIVYGDQVAITNFEESIVTVLVESKYIAETFRIMFEYIWEHENH